MHEISNRPTTLSKNPLAFSLFLCYKLFSTTLDIRASLASRPQHKFLFAVEPHNSNRIKYLPLNILESDICGISFPHPADSRIFTKNIGGVGGGRSNADAVCGAHRTQRKTSR